MTEEFAQERAGSDADVADVLVGDIAVTPYVCWGVVDENLVLFNPEDRRLHVLNSTAAMVWALAEGTSVETLIERVATEYDKPNEEIADDVLAVTRRLLDAELCRISGSDKAAWVAPELPTDRGPEFPEVAEHTVIGPFEALGSAVAVVVEDKRLRLELQRVLSPLSCTTAFVDEAKSRIVYHIELDELGFNLRANDDHLARGTTRPLALRTLLSDLNSRAIGFIDDALVMHASSVEIGENVVAFPGVPNAGKSTLAAQLVDRGAGYLTDEALAVRHESLIAQPFHKSICVERGSQTRLVHLAPDGESDARGPAWDVDPTTIGPGVLSDGGPVSTVIFPIYRPHTPSPSFRRLDVIETVHLLLANSFDFSAIGQPGFAVLVRLANTVPAFEVAHGGAGHLELIEEVVRSSGAVDAVLPEAS